MGVSYWNDHIPLRRFPIRLYLVHGDRYARPLSHCTMHSNTRRRFRDRFDQFRREHKNRHVVCSKFRTPVDSTKGPRKPATSIRAHHNRCVSSLPAVRSTALYSVIFASVRPIFLSGAQKIESLRQHPLRPFLDNAKP